MTNSSTILHVLPGKVADRSHIEAVVKAYPTVFGFALQHEGELVCENIPKSVPIDDIMATMEMAKDSHRVFFFGNWPSFADETDVQPFIFSNEEGAPTVAIFYEGKFDGYAGMDGKHTAENCAFEAVIADQIMKCHDADLDKFVGNLKSDNFKRVLNNTFKDRGWFTFLPVIGAPFSFGSNSDSVGFDWGTVSNKANIDFPQPKVEPVVENKSPLGFLNRRKPSGTAVDNKPDIELPKTDTTIPWKQVEVPQQLVGGARNGWIRLFYGAKAVGLIGGSGELPGDHQKNKLTIAVHPELIPFTLHTVKNSKEVKSLYDVVKKARGLKDGTPADMRDDNDGKSTVREPASNYTGKSSDFIPAMNEEEKTRAMETMLKFLDAQSKKRVTPLELQKIEAKWPTFTQELGVDFNEMLFRTPDELVELFDGSKKAACAYIEMRRKFIEASGVKLEDLVASAKPDEGKASEGKVEAPPTAAAEAGSKKSPLGFLNRKKPAVAA